MRRREQREHVFKLMFMTEFNSEEEMTEQLSLYFEGLGELSEQDQEYMKKKYAHVKEHLEEIDAQLNSASRGWKTKRMSRVDLAALRLAVYEMEYDADVPTGVAINEAVELAKRFGGDRNNLICNVNFTDSAQILYLICCSFFCHGKPSYGYNIFVRNFILLYQKKL